MTDAEMGAAIWPIYQRYVGLLNDETTRRIFCVEAWAVLGPDDATQCLVCDGTNNPPAVVAANGFVFDFFFKRDGNRFHMSSGELIRAHRAGKF